MAKRKWKPRVYNWIARGYKDGLAGTPFKHAPMKGIDKIERANWTPEAEQYMDGYLTGTEVRNTEMGLIKNDGAESLPANPN